MKTHKHINGEYTQQESLKLDQLSLNNAKSKLQIKLNPIAKEFYENEVINLTENIKKRKEFILNNEN